MQSDGLSSERREAIEELAKLPQCRELGLRIVELARGRCSMRLDYQERLVGNPKTGVLHGGAISTLIDSVCGMVVFSVLDGPKPVATLDLRIDYLKPALPPKSLLATAECYKMTRNIAFVRGTAYHDRPDDPVASCVATFMVGSVGFAVGPRQDS